MCIYCGTNKYRKIYENHFGPIPKDESSRSYEIHHIDGNHSNNDPSNLKCVTIQEHYDIHESQGDWNACYRIGGKMKLSPDLLSELASISAKKRVEDGSHHFLGGDIQRRSALEQVSKGIHTLQKRADGSSVSSDLVMSGRHHFQRRPDGSSLTKDRVNAGTNLFTKTGEEHPKYLDTMYVFKNKHTGEVVTATYYDFRTRFNLDPSNVKRIIKNPNKSLHGWQMVTRVEASFQE